MVEDFRARVREWLTAHRGAAREGFAHGDIDVAGARHFQGLLHKAGLTGLCWPTGSGGQGLSEQHQRAFDEVTAEFDLPTEPFTIGLTMVGPTLLEMGTPAQRDRYLPPMLRGEEIWCQLLSEPGAGSDLAALSTRAEPDGDGFVVTGHKVWTSRAQWADLGVLMTRTGSGAGTARHAGLTMLVVDMDAPGVTVRPIRDMAGREVFNEVFLDDVRIPAGRVVGERDGGWAAVMAMLAHERSAGGAQLRASATAGVVRRLIDAVAARDVGHRPEVRQRLAELYVRDRALELFRARLDQETVAGRPAGQRGSVAKLAWGGLDRLVADVTSELLGPDVVAWLPESEQDDGVDHEHWARTVCVALSTGIAGGTDEIQRGIVGERLLGLPR
jgi:alkylation response protein AidB-like acyl-CoA dehydrogenase